MVLKHLSYMEGIKWKYQLFAMETYYYRAFPGEGDAWSLTLKGGAWNYLENFLCESWGMRESTMVLLPSEKSSKLTSQRRDSACTLGVGNRESWVGIPYGLDVVPPKKEWLCGYIRSCPTITRGWGCGSVKIDIAAWHESWRNRFIWSWRIHLILKATLRRKRLCLSMRNLRMVTFQSSTEEEKTFVKRLRMERVCFSGRGDP